MSGAALVVLAAGAAACGPFGSDDGKPAAAEGRSFTVAAAGDILIHPELTEQAAKDAKTTGNGEAGLDFDPIMAGMKPVISRADLAICHFEPVASASPKGPFESFPAFIVPPQITTTIKSIGYDTCSTASNHSLDHGATGVTNTLNALDKAGVKHTGSARSAAEASKPNIIDVKGVKVAQLSFAGGFNGHEIPEKKPWLVNQTSLRSIKAAERRARTAGADVVILSIHWGREHQPTPNANQLRLARSIAEETGIDLVIGHHAHVVQPMEKIDGTWIAYGLGNQIARHEVPSGLSEEGVTGWFEFTEHGGEWDVQAKYVPTFIEIPPDPDETGAVPEGSVEDHRLVDVAAALRDGDKLSAQQRARYRLAFERTEGTLLNRGAGQDGLKPLHPLP
ncbi:CapA family protein [Streptomyces sp. SID5785]|nr:CapA family protein [Streptomyces sp. SID5785]MZD03677.1 CapA family protein [Streptomyces sp. SID5785]